MRGLTSFLYVCVCVQIRQLERQLTMRDLKLSETEQTLRELQYCTYDGVFVWKIADFSHRRQDALAGRSPALFSPGEPSVFSDVECNGITAIS